MNAGACKRDILYRAKNKNKNKNKNNLDNYMKYQLNL